MTHVKFKPTHKIPDDATELAYYAAYSRGRAPRIVKVARHTATTVQLEGMEKLFRKTDGVEKTPGGYSRGHVDLVTDQVRDRIAAQELHGELSRLHRLLTGKVNELGDARGWARNVADVKAYMAKLQQACAALGVPQDQVHPNPFDGQVEKPDGS